MWYPVLKPEEISNKESACLPKEKTPACIVKTPGLFLDGYPHFLLAIHRNMNRWHGLCSSLASTAHIHFTHYY